MFTPLARTFFCVAALLGVSAASPAYAQDETPASVRDYDVFVDLPTAFAFIKLPTGWKFIGKLDAEQLRQLPPGTLTSLLPPNDAATRLADQMKGRTSGKS
jgi:hypothetical protein